VVDAVLWYSWNARCMAASRMVSAQMVSSQYDCVSVCRIGDSANSTTRKMAQ
jgi:hypothetical protein